MRNSLIFAILLHTGCAFVFGDVDRDGDGIPTGPDCSDIDAAVGAPATWYPDDDKDGFGDPLHGAEFCDQPEGYVADATDCDDTEATTNPDARELCDDGEDNDCDTIVDDDAEQYPWYVDADEDGFGDPEMSVQDCTNPEGYVEDNTDCDDTEDTTFPGADEYCDTVDNDCDQEIDEDHAVDVITWYRDQDSDSFGNPEISDIDCEQPAGYVQDSTDCDDSLNSVYPGADEYCNNIDDDCDEVTDEDDAVDVLEWYEDADTDTFGNANSTTDACWQPKGYVADSTDCDDTRASVYPDADEYCNERDDDCDEVVDESDALDATTWYADSDADSYGDPDTSTNACSQPSGYVTDNTDCDDTSDACNPVANEICDALDNDCDTLVDDDDDSVDITTGTYWYEDSDTDGYGNPSMSVLNCAGRSGFVDNDEDCDDTDSAVTVGDTWYEDADGDYYGNPDATLVACELPSGHTSDSSDCDDTDENVFPGAEEICNEIDDNCNGDTDGDDEVVDADTWYEDADGDGYGNVDSPAYACEAPSGFVDNDEDCDDTDEDLHPDTLWYEDADGDGYGTTTSMTMQCNAPSGYSLDDTDCDDTSADAYPGGEEVGWRVDNCSDGYDNDCNGLIDTEEAICLDIEGDGIPNGIDDIFPYDMDGDGITENLCVNANEVFEEPFNAADAIFIGIGFSGSGGDSYFHANLESTVYDHDGDGIADNTISLTVLDVDGLSVNAHCIDFSDWDEGEYKADILSTLSIDGSTAVDPADCGTYEYMDISDFCGVYNDDYCTDLPTTDGCGYVNYALRIVYSVTAGLSAY